MKEYQIIYRDGHTEEIECADRSALVNYHFNGDQQRFLDEVRLLRWWSLSTMYEIDLQNDTQSAQIFSADVNPYGWRNQ